MNVLPLFIALGIECSCGLGCLSEEPAIMLPHSSRGSIFDTPNRSWNNKVSLNCLIGDPCDNFDPAVGTAVSLCCDPICKSRYCHISSIQDGPHGRAAGCQFRIFGAAVVDHCQCFFDVGE